MAGKQNGARMCRVSYLSSHNDNDKYNTLSTIRQHIKYNTTSTIHRRHISPRPQTQFNGNTCRNFFFHRNHKPPLLIYRHLSFFPNVIQNNRRSWHASYKLVSSFYPFVKITFQCRAQSNINLISWQFSSDVKLHTGWSIMCRASMPMEQIIGGTVINIQNGGERDFSKARPWLVSDKITPCSFVNVVAIDWSELTFILDHDFHCTSRLRWSSQCRRCKNSLTRSLNLSAFLGGW